MNTHKRLFAALALGVVTIVALFSISFARPARANRDESNDPRREVNALPSVGIANGQTLHITFLNTGDNPFEIIPCVLDGDGADVKEGRAHTLAPGQMRSFDVSRTEVGERTERHVQLRAVVHIDQQNLKNLVVTGEVVEDETGRSSLFVPGLRVGFDPQPDPPSSN
jgi:hypothetical protein